MIEILITILNMSIGASIVAVTVMLARLLLKKAPKVFSYAIWGIVFLRLAFPFHFESPVSFMPTQAEIIPPTIASQVTPGINSGVPAIDEPVNQLMRGASPQVSPSASATPLQIALSIGAAVWVLGVATLVLYGTISYVRLKRRVYDATLEHDKIYRTDKIQTAFVLGLIRPKVYIPTGIEGAQLAHILKHEQVHIRRRDYLVKPLAFLVLAVHWFNPIVWASYYFLSKDMETSCDEAVLRKSSEDIRRDYSACLVNLYTRKPRLLSPLAFGEGSYRNMKSRIKNVLKFKKPSRWTVIACLLLVAVLVAGCTTNPPKPLVPEDLTASQPVNNVQNSGQQASATPQASPAEATTATQSVTYGNVWMARPPIDPDFPDGVHPRPHPHIQWSVTNGTDRAIHTIQRGMLAFDKDGQPLKIHWNIFTDDENMFFHLPGDDECGTMGLRPGETFGKENDGDGWGWSLNYDGEDPVVDEIAYVLFCDKQIVFEDGTVWDNPGFDDWRATYEGQKVDVNALENYYPHVQNIEMAERPHQTE